MARYLLDTDTLTLWQHQHAVVTRQILTHAADDVSICTITLEEQISGWSSIARTVRRPADIENAAALLARLVTSWGGFPIIHYSAPALARFQALLRAKLKVRGNDLRIAAVALELGATVVTRNRRDFGRVAGLLLEDWSI